ncbi:hypothetical protein [Tardiphaga sp. P9-11]|uniref:hypothetical protein n=1 Tax=Tardiphaga sp. P9-11 TaxID=2024614 RepID=UPI0011F1356E|nr:hypothetical protein [Tardiphaga sp. P9-11]KAA0069972.1 hypothetical protein CIW50_27775 [Tardiphaga sp. P9-11]
MSEKVNTQGWQAAQFRLDAREKVREIRTLLRASVREIVDEARQVYGREKVARSIESTISGENLADTRQLLSFLQSKPRQLGPIRDAGAMAFLIVAVERRLDRFQSLKEFDDFSARAAHVETLRGREREAETVNLRTDRDYYYSNFHAREVRYGPARGGPGDTASIGAVKTSERDPRIDRNVLVPTYRYAEHSQSALRRILDDMANSRTKPLVKPVEPAKEQKRGAEVANSLERDRALPSLSRVEELDRER